MLSQGQFGHLDARFEAPSPTDETTVVNELHIGEIWDLLNFFWAQTSPSLAEWYTHIETGALGWDSLNAEHLAGICEEYEFYQPFLTLFLLNVKQVIFPRAGVLDEHEFSGRVESLTLLPSIFDLFSSRHKHLCDGVNLPVELLLNHLHGLLELLILVHVSRGIPCLVESGNTGPESGVDPVALLLGDGDTIIFCVNLLNEVLIELLIDFVVVGVTEGGSGVWPDLSQYLLEDLFAKVLVDEASTGKLDANLTGWLSEGLILVLFPGHVERTLVMIESVLGHIEDRAHIHYNV
jgi:hypothetical protein